jgi:hypothetical protein
LSLFLFLSLAFLKRYVELIDASNLSRVSLPGRDYIISDIDFVRVSGLSAGYISTVILAIYFSSNQTGSIPSSSYNLQWLCVPLILLWINWIWFSATRGRVDGDPIIFALQNRVSLITGFLFFIFFIAV